MGDLKPEHLAALLIAFFLGGFAFLYGSHFALLNAACDGEDHCVREWISATSGWAATAVAGVTVFFLIRQIKDARRVVEIAGETLTETRRSEERQQRAYVYAGQTEFDITNGIATILLEITNEGNTPAKDVSIERHAYLGPKEKEDDRQVSTRTTLGDMAPGQKRYSRTNLTVKKYEQDLEKGSTRMHLSVMIRYRDIFDQERETSFRLVSPLQINDKFMLINEAVSST